MNRIDVGTALLCLLLVAYVAIAIKGEGKETALRAVLFLAIVVAMFMAFNAGFEAWEGG
ncbi:MAG: hypothetical protein K5696_07570 [Lachnospiraceae bacterium]|nr:hypothetical protein [Lachnospiraceae bacterium]